MFSQLEGFSKRSEEVCEEVMVKLGYSAVPYRGEPMFHITRDGNSGLNDAIRRALARFS